jgi:transposase-like protein
MRIKRRVRPMMGFKSERTAPIILGGIELIHLIRKGQMIPVNDARNPSLAEQFDRLAV